MATASQLEPRQSRATPSHASAHAPAPSERLHSLDVLRGFDMFWIFGGDELLRALPKVTGWAFAGVLAAQMQHVAWAGFHCYDLIFPMFIFISGVTLPLAFARRQAQGVSRGRIILQLFRRALLLFILGLLYNNKKVTFDIDQIRLASVLGRIGLAGLGAGLIVLFARPRAQVCCVVGLLTLYWALMTFVPVPGQPVHSFEIGKNLADYIDVRVLPGKLGLSADLGIHEPQGLLSTIPSIPLALLGALAGAWLASAHSAGRKVLGLLGAGLLLLALGWLWSFQFPIIKHLWTSSFILFAAGWSCLLLAFFYAIVDGLRWRRWAFLFVLIGMNPLTIYWLKGTNLIDFKAIGQFFFSSAIAHAPAPWQPIGSAVAMMTVQFVFLYVLWRRKIFLRV